VALKQDILTQNESVKQRLAERRRSRAPRASSTNQNDSMSLNFGTVQKEEIIMSGNLEGVSVGL
jgi:hypothetical protein